MQSGAWLFDLTEDNYNRELFSLNCSHLGQHTAGELCVLEGRFSFSPNLQHVWKRNEANRDRLNSVVFFPNGFLVQCQMYQEPKTRGEGSRPPRLWFMLSQLALLPTRCFPGDVANKTASHTELNPEADEQVKQ
ncbi:Kininogen-1 [Clarias magur]|uniref:Kininogen-1 n=1 Tax=Clarias magur TaxID=1594786 RepID=A0A8J4TGU4_CLAMG|nr:Kininogen-1 [Clarias magur]